MSPNIGPLIKQDDSTPPLRRLQLGAVQLAFDDTGNGEPMLCIHGSWDDHHSWNGVGTALRNEFRVVRYDRRGHSASSAPPGQGRLSEDVADALQLMERLQLPPAHIIAHSYGANIAIALATTAPDATRSLFIHEPPVFSLLAGDPKSEQLRTEAAGLMKQAANLIEQGEIEMGARLFIEQVAFGKGSWCELFDESARTVILSNVDTWLDQFHDPERLAVDVTMLRDYPHRITLSTGSATLPAYREVTQRIVAKVPAVHVTTIMGAAHGAHISHPEAVAQAIRAHLSEVSAA